LVRLYEYQGKQLLKSAGIPVPDGDVATMPEEARKIAERIKAPVAIKSQILAGGRGKAGGIKFADTPSEAEKLAHSLLGSEIRKFKVEKVLVERKIDIKKEYYAGIVVNDSYKVKAPVLMFSTEGGVEIEAVASESPGKIASMNIDILEGVKQKDLESLVSKMDVPHDFLGEVTSILLHLYELFRKYGARAWEINPLVVAPTGLIAADCRVMIDDSSVPLHPELGIEIPRETTETPTKLDRLGWKIEEGDYRGVGFFMQMTPTIHEKGYVGFHGIGGGGAMLGADALQQRGLTIADYADTSGNPTAAKIYRVAKLVLSQAGIEGYFLSGACIASQEQWHHGHGLVKALREMLIDKPGFPVVLLLAGNKEQEALGILKEGLKDLNLRLEIYGREHVYDVDFLADRMISLVEQYRKSRGLVKK